MPARRPGNLASHAARIKGAEVADESEEGEATEELAFLDAVLESLSCPEKSLTLPRQQLLPTQPPPQTSQSLWAPQPQPQPGGASQSSGGSVRQRSRIVTNGLLASPVPGPANGDWAGSEAKCRQQNQQYHPQLQQSEEPAGEEQAEARNEVEEQRPPQPSTPPPPSTSSPASPSAARRRNRRRHRLQRMSSCPEPPLLSVSSPDLALGCASDDEEEAAGCAGDPEVEVNLQRARVFYAMAMRALSARRDQLLQLQDRLLFFQSARQDCKRRLNQLKNRLAELNELIDAKVNEFDSSRACITDQSNSKRLSFDNAQEMLGVAKRCYSERMKEIMQERKQTQMQLDEARAALQTLEEESAELEHRLEAEGDPQAKRRLRDQIKQVEDRLDAQRRIYEDLEFKELEDQSRVEEEREHLFREVVSQQSELIHKFKDKEAAIEQLQAQERESAARAQSELDGLEAERSQVLTGIRREKQRVRVADSKLRELRSRLPQQQPPQPQLLAPLHGQQHAASGGRRGDAPAAWMEGPGGIMTSSGYASHRGAGGGGGGASYWWGLSPVSDDSQSTTDEASYQSSIMTASLHEDLHGRFNESAPSAAAPTTESCGTYDNPTSLVNSYHADVSTGFFLNGQNEEASAAHPQQQGPLNRPQQQKQLRQDHQDLEQWSNQPNFQQQSQPSPQKQQQQQQPQHQHLQLQMSQPEESASASEVTKRYQRIGSDSSSGGTVPSLTAVDNKSAKKNRPLTRYMPCSDPEFDLREHLLGLGHPLDLMQRLVEVTPCSCRGYLTKQGGKFKSWKKRWFVLDRYRKTFTYFADRSEAKIKGCVSFCDIQDAYIDRTPAGKSVGVSVVGRSGPGKRGAAAAVFCVATNERTYRCVAPSPETMRVWLDSVFTAAEGYLMQTQLLE